ncbi:Cardiolipin synthase 1, partial [Operophtera brumata]
MRLLARSCFIKQVTNVCRPNAKQNSNIPIRQFMLIVTNKRQLVRYPLETSLSCFYSSESKKHFITLEKKADAIKDAFEHRRGQLKDTEQKFRLKGEEIVRDIKHQKEVTGEKLRVRKEHIIKDILETKAKVKERIEGVVEKENVFTVPNVLCITRIVMSPYLGYVIMQSEYNLALGLLVFAGVTDLLDGWIARNWEGQSTTMGSFLDPLADKVLIATLFVSLTWQHLIPLPLTLLIVGRDAALVIAGFVIRYMSLPAP